MLSAILLLLFTCSINAPLVCDPETGYQEYLDAYGYGYKYDSADTEYDNSSVEAYITNCNVFNKKEERGKNPEVTALLDWSDDDLEELGDLAVKYSGNPSFHESETVEEASFSLTREPRVFTDSSLKDYNQKKRKCSTSWATSVIEVAEAAVSDKHFSVDQLLQCVPKYSDMDSDCHGVIPKDLVAYLSEVGLVEKDVFTGCDDIEMQTRYVFKAEYPVPNKSGLMNLVAKGKPVFTMLALDLKKLRYVKDMKDSQETYSCAFDQPTLYAIVSGYDSESENAYWEIISHVIPAEEIVVRIPMGKNEGNANYAGIAAYAFTLGEAEEIQGSSNLKMKIVYTYPTTLNGDHSYTLTDAYGNIQEFVLNAAGENNMIENIVDVTSPTYTLKLSNSIALWAGAELTVYLSLGNGAYETVLKTSCDNSLPLPLTYIINTRFAITAGYNWLFNAGTASADWRTADTGFVSTAASAFPPATSGYQLFKKTITIAENALADVAGFVLSLRYPFGIVVYINSQEVFRFGVEGEYPSATYSAPIISKDVNNPYYQQISLPIYYYSGETLISYLTEGSNTIQVLLMAKEDETTTATFDCALRLLQGDSSYQRTFDVDYTGSTVSEPNHAFGYWFARQATSDTCDHSLVFQFNNDRREWINSLTLHTYQYGTLYGPNMFKFSAKNVEDSEWTTLLDVSNAGFVKKGDRIQFKLVNHKSFNMFKIENTATDEDSCKWGIALVNLQLLHYHNIPDLSYPNSNIMRLGVYNTPIGTASNHYLYLSSSPTLPEGLVLEENSLITGTPTVITPSTEYSISYYKLDGSSKSATVTIETSLCGGELSMITATVNTNNFNENWLEIYLGEDTTGSLLGATNTALTLCYAPGIYTAKLRDIISDQGGNYLRQMKKYTLSVDGFAFAYGAVKGTTTEYTSKFSATIPFKSSSEWKIYKGAEPVAEDWKTAQVNWDSMIASNFGESDASTVYIRKEFAIPSLSDYHVLNVQVKYTGGIVAYFNGHKVARFNLAEDLTTVLSSKTSTTTATFSIILSEYDASLESNVIAFEIHSASTGLHAITFEATGAYGVNECSLLTNSVSGKIYNNLYSEHYIRTLFDMNPATYQELHLSGSYSSHNKLYISNPDELNAYVQWSIDNLEPTKYNAFGYLQVQMDNFDGCEVELQIPDCAQVFSTIAAARDRTYTTFDIESYLTLEGAMRSEREFKINVPKMCGPSDVAPAFAEVYLEYCVAPSCAADGEYPAVMNGQKSVIRCPTGYSGFKSRNCVNGVLEETVDDQCVAENKITYGRENLIFMLKDEEVRIVPETIHPVTSFSISGELPAGLSFESDTGAIKGTPTAITGEIVLTINAGDSSASAQVVIVVREEEIFAITKGAVVTDASTNAVVSTISEITTTVYDYYDLDKSKEYIVLKQEGAVVIPFYGEVWKYERPTLYYSWKTTGSATSISSLTITAADMFTHYTYHFTNCPAGKKYISVHNNNRQFHQQYCVTPDTNLKITTYNNDVTVTTALGNVVPITKTEDIYKYHKVPTDESALESVGVCVSKSEGGSGSQEESSQETIHSFAEATIPEATTTLLTTAENLGIVSMGPYAMWTSTTYSSKILMNIPTSSTSSATNTPIAFGTQKKKSIFDYYNVDNLPSTVIEMKDYVTETAVTLMEIVYYMKNQQKINLSRSQLKELVTSSCTQDNCYEQVIQVLQSTGICKEGEESNVSCTHYKISGFATQSPSDVTPNWIKTQVDSGKPVFTLLSLNSDLLQHHTSSCKEPIKTQGSAMNFGGVVVGYNAEKAGSEYWEVIARRHTFGSFNNNLIKVKLDTTGVNFAHIASYAFTIEDVDV